jgi:hypothetical protein
MSKLRFFWLGAGAAAIASFALLASSCASAESSDEGDDDDGGEPPPPVIKPLTAVPGIEISEIALYQGLKRPLAAAGQPVTSDVPIIEGRASVLRIFIGGTVPSDTPITARLYIGESKALEVTRNLTTASSEAVYDSTINFELPANGIIATTTYHVEVGVITEPAAAVGATPPLVYPAMGQEAIPATTTNGGLEIMLVPIAYNADGSGRLPDTSDTQLKLYKDGFYGMYPVPEVTLTVHEPFMWDQEIDPGGFGWDQLLDAMAQLRASDQNPSRVYYYGVMAPANSEGQFCAGGCVLGLGMLGPASDTYSRTAIGLGYPGKTSVETALHEVGHNHGRYHSGCGTESDPSFPSDPAHAGGKNGVWGMDLFTHTMYPPTYPDIMGYCVPLWISDYTYKGLLERVVSVNGEPMMRQRGPGEAAPERVVYERISVGGDGRAQWRSPVTLDSPPGAPTREVILSSDAPDERVLGHFYQYDHLPGGVLLVRQPARAYKAMAFEVGGRVVRLQR